jgi:hypothetical protein
MGRRNSDRMSDHRETLKVGITPMGRGPDVAEIRAIAQRKQEYERRGWKQLDTTARLCACGNTALWVWGTTGYCRKCRPEKVPTFRRTRERVR